MKIYTRTGDAGQTALFGGGRVPKDDARVAAYGEVDELNSVLGLVRSTEPSGFFDPLFETIQRDLFSIGGQLATPDPSRVTKALEKAELSASRVSEFERIMDEAERSCCRSGRSCFPRVPLRPSALHLARTVCRRAERSVVSLAQSSDVPAPFLVYLNRLSDLLFTLARLANHRAGVSDVTW